MKNTQLNSPTSNSVIFCLTRGYFGVQKYRYLKLILRNHLISKALKNSNKTFDSMIFHEGNISRLDQFLIKLFSLNFQIKFKAISNYFENYSPLSTPNIFGSSLGYIMMCRFQYGKVWGYLKEYEIVVRIDDDCFISEIPILKENQVFVCAGISEENHQGTNESFFSYLETLKLENFYDHKFPYTNLYATRNSFWQQESVKMFLNSILDNPKSLDHRWGDLPVIGVALKVFADWKYNESILLNFNYNHYSHRSLILNGNIDYEVTNKFKLLVKSIKLLF
jgi:hypothetical protein